MLHLVAFGHALLITVFGTAFFGKVRSRTRFRQFTESIRTLGMLPPRVVRPLVTLLVTVEGATVLWLLTPLPPRVGFLLAAGLLLVFLGVVFRAVRGGIFAECRCFGRGGAVMSNAMAVRNLFLLACALPGALVAPGRLVPPSLASVPALGAGVLGAVLLIRYYDVLVRKLVIRARSAPSPDAAVGR